MRLDHHDYIKLLIGTYKKKRINNELSLLLSQPTPANIRQECYNVYRERYEKRDEPALRAFFGPEEHGKKFLDFIQNFDINKFRPLVLYLKKEGNKRVTVKSLELLAWLINFRHRPYVFGKEVILSEDELLILGDRENDLLMGFVDLECEDEDLEPFPEGNEEETKKGSENLSINGTDKAGETCLNLSKPINLTETTPKPNPRPINPADTTGILNNQEEGETTDKIHVITQSPFVSKKKRNELGSKRAVVFFLILVICTGAIYTLWQQKQDNQMMALGNPNTGCMYWTGDHYDTVSCADKNSNRLKLPLDLERMRNFKRITREDTITEKSIGKIYYIRINGGREYYTAGGNHPVEVTKTLKVFSRYMFEQHFRDKAPVNGSVAQGTLKFINNR